MTQHASAAPVTPFMRMGCTNVTITYRWEGFETVCLQSPSHGVQQLANFDPSKGDVIGLDDILELTTAKADLSDVAKYITSAVSNGSTTLYFDPTGHGLRGTPFAVLQGVSTSVAQLVADGGMKYVPDAIKVQEQFNTPLTFRPAGLETVELVRPAPGVGPEQLNRFQLGVADRLELHSVLNATTAAPDLSNVANYISANVVNGNTVLSVDATGHGLPGMAFVELNGVSTSVAQLMADGALVFDPTATEVGARGGQVFQFRPEGQETAMLPSHPAHDGYATLQGFSAALGDALDLSALFGANAISTSLAHIGNYVSTTESAGSTALWFDHTGSGRGGGVELALLQGVNTSLTNLIAGNALHIS